MGKRGVAVVGLAAAIVSSGLLTVAGGAPASAAPSGLQVFVGYADSIRPSPAHFPTPWDGAPNTIFEGCTPSCQFDSSAVRVVNTTAVAQPIDSVVVKFDTCIYDIWPHQVTLASGQQLIITQLSSTTVSGCVPSQGSFDGSDIGIAPNCVNDGIIPEVDLSVAGVTSVFRDTGQVLNTGGIDTSACAGPNEAIQWTTIGNVPCPGATLTLAPPDQTVPAHSNATLSATLANSCGTGLSGAAIGFQVAAGPNTGTSGKAPTDANGVATFSFASAVIGTDTVFAAASNPGGLIFSNSATVTWVRAPTATTLTSSPNPSAVGQPVTFTATVTPVHPTTARPGGTVAFYDGSTALGTATLNNGTPDQATLRVSSLSAGTHTITATYAGDPTFAGSTSAAVSQVVARLATHLTATPAVAGLAGPTLYLLTLNATLTRADNGAPLAGQTIAFSAGSTPICTAVTGANGVASCSGSMSALDILLSDGYRATFAGTASYQPSSASAPLIG